MRGQRHGGTAGDARAASGRTPDSAGSATTIKIDNFSFDPSSTTVSAGRTITWVNADDVPHKIVSTDGRFAPSPPLDTDDRYALPFKLAGRYGYFCALHPRTTGTIVVH